MERTHFFFTLLLHPQKLCQLLSVSLARGLWLSRDKTLIITLADDRLKIPFPIFYLYMPLFIYFALFLICITTYCIFFLLLLLLVYPYLHNAHVYVLTDQFAALSNHESGCCSGCVKSGGQQRKAICLLRLRAELCCLKTLQVT